MPLTLTILAKIAVLGGAREDAVTRCTDTRPATETTDMGLPTLVMPIWCSHGLFNRPPSFDVQTPPLPLNFCTVLLVQGPSILSLREGVSAHTHPPQSNWDEHR